MEDYHSGSHWHHVGRSDGGASWLCGFWSLHTALRKARSGSWLSFAGLRFWGDAKAVMDDGAGRSAQRLSWLAGIGTAVRDGWRGAQTMVGLLGEAAVFPVVRARRTRTSVRGAECKPKTALVWRAHRPLLNHGVGQ